MDDEETTVPDTQPMTGVEMTRAVNRIETGIAAISLKLDSKPNWSDIDRIVHNRDVEQEKQDKAIKAVEDDLVTLGTKTEVSLGALSTRSEAAVTTLSTKTDTAVDAVNGRINSLLMAVVASYLAIGGGLITTLVLR